MKQETLKKMNKKFQGSLVVAMIIAMSLSLFSFGFAPLVMATAQSTLTADEIVANVPASTIPAVTFAGGVDEVKAVQTLTVVSLPADAETITIGTCVVSFADGAGTGDNSGAINEVDCTDDAATLNNYTTVNPGVALTAAEMAALLRSLTNVSDTDHGALTVGGATVVATFTTTGAEVTASNIAFTDGTTGKITNVAITAVVEDVAVDTITIADALVADAVDHSVEIDGLGAIDLGIAALTAAEVADAIVTGITGAGGYGAKDYTVGVVGADITFTQKVAGTAGNGALTIDDDTYNTIAQEVTFTPASVTIAETFNVVIGGTTYSFEATSNTVQSVVEGLQPLIDANAAVTCTEDDLKVTCVADVPGTEFTYSVSVTEAPSSGGIITPTPLPPVVTAINVPLIVSTGQSGTMMLTFEDASSIKIEVPKGAVSGVTTFNVAMTMAISGEMPASSTVAILVGNKIFNISARDSKNNIVKNFSSDLKVTVFLPELTSNTSGLGVYWLNEVSGLWTLVAGADFSTMGFVTFDIGHLTKFAVINTINTPGIISTLGESGISVEEPTLIGSKIYADGTLVRTPDKRIYVVIGGKLQHVTTLQELIQYVGKKILNVGYGNISGYEKIVPAAKKYADGSLIRATNKKIYVIMNGKKQQIMNLVELRVKHANKPIHNVSDNVVDQY